MREEAVVPSGNALRQALASLPAEEQDKVQRPTGEKLTYVEVAKRTQSLGTVIQGSTLYIADSALVSYRSMAWNGVPLVKPKGVCMRPLITAALTKLDRKGLVCYAVTSGGYVKDILKALRGAVAELEQEGRRLNNIAEGRFPKFEHGTVVLFHNDHAEGNKMRGQRSYKADKDWTQKELVLKNDQYWQLRSHRSYPP